MEIIEACAMLNLYPKLETGRDGPCIFKMKNIMKKILAFGTVAALVTVAAMEACTKIDADQAQTLKTINTKVEYVEPATTKAADWRVPVDGKYQVYYYIRIDGNIPGEDETNLPAKAYFPQTSTRKSAMTTLNSGTVLSYVDWKSGKFPQYIYSKDGSSVQSIIVDEPTLEDLVNADKGPGNDFSGYLKHKEDLHFLWYICKRQDADKCWHIDGILTTKDRKNIADTDYGAEIMENYKTMTDDEGSVVKTDNVEFDVHQQEHKDWKEIKTSIHIRAAVDSKIIIPVPQEYQAQADDFAIRAGVQYEYINKTIELGGKSYSFEFEIEHAQEGIVITAKAKDNAEALKAAMDLYGDGVTFEVHTYAVNDITDDQLWAYLKQTQCLRTTVTDDFTGPQACNVKGQVTTAFSEEKIEFKQFAGE